MHPVREGILRGTLCRHLRSKGMFTGEEDPATLPPGAAAEPPPRIEAAGWWCNVSGWAMGPDVLPANADRCVGGRGCFEAAVEV